MLEHIKVGDRIKFRVNAFWADRDTAWRVVRTVTPQLTVRIGGWSDYIVDEDELLEHAPKQ